jgi:hypothetical protein
MISLKPAASQRQIAGKTQAGLLLLKRKATAITARLTNEHKPPLAPKEPLVSTSSPLISSETREEWGTDSTHGFHKQRYGNCYWFNDDLRLNLVIEIFLLNIKWFFE